MAKPEASPKKTWTCRYCSKAGVPKSENKFKSKTALRAHERGRHSKRGRPANKDRAGKPAPKTSGEEVVIQKPINYCCFCGEQLPNATIIR